MKKLVSLLVVAAFATSPAAAASKHKKAEQTAEAKQQAAEAEDIAKQHDNTLRALRDGLPLVLPSWSLPVFFGTHMDEKLKGETKTEKKKEVKVHRRASPTPASNR